MGSLGHKIDRFMIEPCLWAWQVVEILHFICKFDRLTLFNLIEVEWLVIILKIFNFVLIIIEFLNWFIIILLTKAFKAHIMRDIIIRFSWFWLRIVYLVQKLILEIDVVVKIFAHILWFVLEEYFRVDVLWEHKVQVLSVFINLIYLRQSLRDIILKMKDWHLTVELYL